jgi:carboxyl-terminal processing protease
MSRGKAITATLAFFLLSGLCATEAPSQQISKLDRGRAQLMLEDISKDVEKNYYDPNLHGVNWNATVAEAKEGIEKSNSLGMALAHIAKALDSLNDSHTFFLPPPHTYTVNYGFQYQMIGDRCYIIRVRPGSDAETKGLKPGDELLTLDNFTPNRADLWKMRYVLNVLRPQPGLQLVVRDPQDHERKLDVMAKVKQLPLVRDVSGNRIWELVREQEYAEHLGRARTATVGGDVSVLKFPGFHFTQSEVHGMINDARKHAGLILDLRGNPGGALDTLKYLLGGVFDKDVTIAKRVGRKQSKPEVAKSMGSQAFTGKLVVLVDSASGSAAELFARVVQLEKRGEVIGDRSSGSVMEAKHYTHDLGQTTIVPFGVSITEADLVMSDGKSLEHTGVTPDEIVLPTAADLAAGRDPVLARAAEILGAKLAPEDAGKMLPYEWPKE